jgi:hypothetical protein
LTYHLRCDPILSLGALHKQELSGDLTLETFEITAVAMML